MAKVTPITDNLENVVAPVYCQYDGQHQPQSAYIMLDCITGKLTADYNSNIGWSCSQQEWDKIALTWSIPYNTLGESLIELFEDEDFLADMQSILDGFEEKWNGSNYVGSFSDEAQALIDHYQEKSERYDWPVELADIYDAADYLFEQGTMREAWDAASGETLDEAVENIETNIDSTTLIDGEIRGAIIDHGVNYCLYSDPGSLDEEHVIALLKMGEIDNDDYKEWKEETGE